jgi:hypothetical protein
MIVALTPSISRRAAPLNISAIAMESPADHKAFLRPMVFSIAAKVEMHGI